MSHAPAPTMRDVLRGRRGGFLMALLLAEFAAAMQGIAYSTVLPVLARDLDGYALFGATLAAGSVAAVLMLSFAVRVLERVPPGRVLVGTTALYVLGAAMAVFAPAMGWVLAGTIVRGIAAGLIAGFGMGAIGALFDERERPRVFGLFSLIWLLPSVAGPPLNAVVTDWIGWRWAVAWPALLVVFARVLMGAMISAVPWQPDRERTAPVRAGVGVLVAGLLALGSVGSAAPTGWGLAALAVGVVGGGLAIGAFLVRSHRDGAGVLIAFALLCATHFGVYELLSLTVIEALGSTVLVASVMITLGLVAWCAIGLRPRPDAVPDRAVGGPVLMAVAVTVVLGGVLAGGLPGLVATGVGSVLLGLGMGAAYPLLSSEPFETGAPASTVGTLIAFAETAAVAWVALLAGGMYSALHGLGWAPAPALVWVHAVLGLIALATVVTALRRRQRPSVRVDEGSQALR